MTTFVLTVLGGVLIFVVGQILLKLVIEPVHELKKALGTVSNALLLHQAKITNASFCMEIALEIKAKSADILSRSDVVLGYRFVRIIFGLPVKSNIVLASRKLNWIIYGMREESKAFEDSSAYSAKKTNFALENSRAIVEVGRLLNVQTTYGDHQ